MSDLYCSPFPFKSVWGSVCVLCVHISLDVSSAILNQMYNKGKEVRNIQSEHVVWFGFLFFAVVFFFFFYFSTLLCRSIFQGFSFWTSHSHSHTHITHHNTNHLVRIELCQFNSLFFLNLCVFMLWLLFFCLSLSFWFTQNPNNKSSLKFPPHTPVAVVVAAAVRQKECMYALWTFAVFIVHNF